MKNGKRMHFIGIGGVGMSGLAEVFLCHGYSVQGSDIRKTRTIGRLRAMGIGVSEFHSAKNIEGVDYVVYSSCIGKDNVEFKEARRINIPILRRIEALNMLMGDKNLVAVSGTHGKSTTTSLISYLLIEAGMDPTVFIGADVYFLDGNARYGKSNLVVTEADESDGSFLLLNPLYSVSTNIDREHMDYYSSMDDVVASYKIFIENTRDKGMAFTCSEDRRLREIVKNSPKRIMRYGLSQDADIKARNIQLQGMDGSSFDLVFKNKILGRVNLSIIGVHNILNSLAAVGIAMDLGVDFSFIKKAISDFKGADRRFRITRLSSDILIIDDYAHHPAEIEATLKTLDGSGRRIVAIFQPHRYSRTKYLKEEFSNCFNLAEHLVITDIYSAHETPLEGVSGQALCESVRNRGHKNVHFVPKDDIIKHLIDVVRAGDALFVLGAGDIDELPGRIANAFEGAVS